MVPPQWLCVKNVKVKTLIEKQSRKFIMTFGIDNSDFPFSHADKFDGILFDCYNF